MLRSLDPLRCGEAIRMRLPGKQEWTLGTCTRVLRNRSYEVEVCGRRYSWNRCQSRSPPEIPPPISSQDLGPPDIYPHKACDAELETTHNYEQDKREPPVTCPSVNNEVNNEVRMFPTRQQALGTNEQTFPALLKLLWQTLHAYQAIAPRSISFYTRIACGAHGLVSTK